MKNTTFRKKALLSSVAMLLVALVALGSATFAWFAANPLAEAHGLSMKTTASAGLVISTDSDTRWTHNALLNAIADPENDGEFIADDTPFNLSPASQSQSNPVTFWYTDAAKSDSWVAATEAESQKPTFSSTTAATHSATSGYAYAENVYFKYSDGTASDKTGTVNITSVKITKANGADMDGCIRVAIVGSDGQLVATTAIGTTANMNKTISAADGTTADFVNLKTGNNGQEIAINAKVSNVAATAKTAENYCTVYVWLDGQDKNCYSDYVKEVNATEIISDIQVNFALGE